MTVKVKYAPGQGKQFTIVSAQNADGIYKRVFEKIIEAERDSSKGQNQEALRVGPENYDFELLGTEERNGEKCYVLRLKPKRKNKFLLDGKAWISAHDFGIVHIEGRPSERISFWIG